MNRFLGNNTFFLIFSVIIVSSLTTNSIFAEESEMPQWIKNTAGWWSDGQIADSDFIQGMEFLINQEIIQVPVTNSSPTTSDTVPEWVKNNAGWWAAGLISDNEFVNGIEFMIGNGIMTIQNSEKIMEMDSTEIAKEMSDTTEEMIMDETAKTDTSVSEEMQDDENAPITTHIGEFSGLQGHNGEGTAKIILVDGATYLRFEDFKVTNGPDLFVYLAPNGDVRDGLLLERLKGSTGDQNYAVPSYVDLDELNTAVVYCKLFGVYFAEAPLK